MAPTPLEDDRATSLAAETSTMLVGPEFPTSSVLPSGEKHRAATPAIGQEAASSGAFMSQSLMWPPSVAEAMDRPSGEKATDQTISRCTSSPSRAPVLRFQ